MATPSQAAATKATTPRASSSAIISTSAAGGNVSGSGRRLARPPRIAKYAAAAEDARHRADAERTVEYVAAARLVAQSISALEERVAAPDRAPAGRPRSAPRPMWWKSSNPQRHHHAAASSPMDRRGANAGGDNDDDALVDAPVFHEAVLSLVKPYIEHHSRTADVGTRPESVRDLVAVPPSSCAVNGGASPRFVPSAVQAHVDSLARVAQRASGQAELFERRALDLRERGGGSANVVLDIPVSAMVSDALAQWSAEADRRQKLADEVKKREQQQHEEHKNGATPRPPPATSAATPVRSGRRMTGGSRRGSTTHPRDGSTEATDAAAVNASTPTSPTTTLFDGAAMVRDIDIALPLAKSLTHMSPLDVATLIQKYVC